MKICVMQKDIETASRARRYLDPIRLATKRAFGLEGLPCDAVRTGNTHLFIAMYSGQDYFEKHRLPRHAISFTEEFDAGCRLYPIEFNINLADGSYSRRYEY